MNNKPIYLTVKDHFVSGEEFQLLYREDLDMLQTYPQPKQQQLQNYYKSKDYISHTNTKRNLLEYVYHFIKQIALKQKIKLINSFQTESKTLLDIGCGTGDFLKIAQKNSWHITGIEPNKNARKIANSKTKHRIFNTEYIKKIEKNSFDIITLWHVLEHLPDIQKQTALLKSLLKPHGVLIIAVPNFKSYDAKY